MTETKDKIHRKQAETVESINKSQACFLKKIHPVDMSLVNLIKKQRTKKKQ
jgi:hypothetical protein